MYRNILFVCVVNAIASQTKAGIFSKLQFLKKNQNQKSTNSAKPVIDYFVPDYHWLNYFSPMLGFIHYGKGEEDPSFYFYNNEKNARFKFVDPNLIEQREIEKAIEHKYLEEEVLKHQLQQIGNGVPNRIPNFVEPRPNPNYHYGNQGFLYNNPVSNKPPIPIPNVNQVVEPNRPLIPHQKPIPNPNHPFRNHLLNRPLRNQILNQALKNQQYFPSSTHSYSETPQSYFSSKEDTHEEHQKKKMEEIDENEQQRVKEVIENLRQIVLDIRNLQQQQVQEVKQIFRQKEQSTTTTMKTTTEKTDDQVKVIESLHQLVQTIREIQQQQAREAEELRKQKQELSRTTTTTPKPVEQYQISNPFYEHVSKPHDFVEEPGFYYVFLKEKDEFKAPPQKGEAEETPKHEIQQETIINVPETTTYKTKFKPSTFGEYIRNNIPKLVNDNINGGDQYKDSPVSYFIQEVPEDTTQGGLTTNQIYIIGNPNPKGGEEGEEKNINMFIIDTSTNEDSDLNNFLIESTKENTHQNYTDFSDGKREKFAYRIRHHLDDSRSKLKNYWHS